ncbi:MAG: hybrid sensor histidine kinase/response regulator [Magnetococcales bacterium]|nr:hybrid sensor histidine kinase/response regulator [Magnetococcales bacterium]
MVKKGTVLVVDDQPEHIDVVKAALEQHFTIKIATNGELGLRLAGQGTTDLILSDIMMPGMDGFELCRQLKANPVTREIPLVFLTAKHNFDDETLGLGLGAMDFIRKPSNPAVVLARVTNLVELYRTRQELVRQNKELVHTLHLREDMERLARHDLKGPLAGIIGLPELLLEDTNLTDEQKELIQVIETNGYTMLEMINNSLDLFKMETGSYPLQPEQFDLMGVLKRITSDLSRHRLSQNIYIDHPPTEEVFFVVGEKLLCYSMFHNLVLNAIQASEAQGDIRIELATDQATRKIVITNPGEVPAATRNHFFAKYVTYGKRGGTGLGTYSAWLSAKTQGGAIELDTSRPGFTSVTVWLPGPK